MRSKSRSRSRSRGRSKSPSRTKKSKSSPSPSPARKSQSASSSRKSAAHKRQTPRTPTTPSRQSARIAALELEKEEERKIAAEKKDKNSVQQAPVQKARKRSVSRSRTRRVVEGAGKLLGKLIGVILLLTALWRMPLLFIAINAACDKAKCTVKEIPKISLDYKSYFSAEVVGVYLGFVALQAMLYALPLGRSVTVPTSKGRRLKTRANAFICLVVTLVAFSVLAYLKQPVNYPTKHFTQLMATSITVSLLVGLLLYIKGRKASASERYEDGNTGNIITDFCNGREVNPHVRGFHFKVFFHSHVFVPSFILLAWSFVLDDYQRSGNLNCAALIVTVGYTIYGLILSFHEEVLIAYNNSKEVYEGFGYFGTFFTTAAPFLYCLTVRFLVQYPQKWNNYYLAAFAAASLVGFVIQWGAQLQKNHFRKNPHDPALAHLERIPTPDGKGLLVGGWWSLCRKPNYLGDLIQWWSWSLLCGFDYAIPHIVALMTTMVLLFRQVEDEHQCKQRHGGAWDRYCQRVRSRLIPKIY